MTHAPPPRKCGGFDRGHGDKGRGRKGSRRVGIRGERLAQFQAESSVRKITDL